MDGIRFFSVIYYPSRFWSDVVLVMAHLSPVVAKLVIHAESATTRMCRSFLSSHSFHTKLAAHRRLNGQLTLHLPYRGTWLTTIVKYRRASTSAAGLQ